MQPIRCADAMSPEWFEDRKNSIGASEISAAAGLSPYQTPLELYSRKRGEIPPLEDNDPMRMGRLLEPVVKSEFVRTTKMELLDPNPPMFRHGTFPMITATPDGIVDAYELLECKTASWRMKGSWGEEDSDDVPTHYLCQCQQQMSVMNASAVHLAVLFDGAQLKLFKVMRNDELIRMLTEAAMDMWDRIQRGVPPEPTWDHASTPELIKAIHGNIIDARIEFDVNEAAMWAEYESLAEMSKAYDKRQKEIKARLLHAIGDNFAGIIGDGRMLRRLEIAPTTFTVNRKAYIDCRAVKCDSGQIIERTPNL